MTNYPHTTADGRTVWACCESTIGPTCRHVATATTTPEDKALHARDVEALRAEANRLVY